MISDSSETIASISPYVEWANVFVAFVLGLRLLRNGLASRYRVLTCYLFFSSAVLVAFQFIPRNTNRFAETYMAVTSIQWVLYFGLAYEAYRRVLEEHKGLASAGRWLVSGGLVLCILVTGITMLAELNATAQKFPILFTFHVAERAISTVLTLLLAVLLGFTLYFPVLLRRNTLLLLTGLTILLLFKALLLLLRNLIGPEAALVLSLGTQVANLVVIGVWLLQLVSVESDRESGPRASVPRERAEQMLRQLGALNELLLRGSGR